MSVSRSGVWWRAFFHQASKCAGGGGVGRDAGVVELEQGVLARHQAAAAGALLELGRLLDEGGVVTEEVVPGLPVALDQGVPDEQLPGQDRVDLRQQQLAVGDDRDAVEGDLLGRDGGAERARPAGLAVAPLDQVRGDRLDPFRFDRGDGPAPQPRGLDQLGRDDPVRWLLREAGAGEDGELGAAGAEVLRQRAAAAFARRPVVRGAGSAGAGGGEHHLHADVGKQAGEQRGVNQGPFGRRRF